MPHLCRLLTALSVSLLLAAAPAVAENPRSSADVLALTGLIEADPAMFGERGAISAVTDALAQAPEGAVLRLDLLVFGDVQARRGGGAFERVEACAFGLMPDVTELAFAAGDYHHPVRVRVGDPLAHAANGVFCAYAPDAAARRDGGDGLEGTIAFKGCFVLLSNSVPTAREIVLNPLPASACGVHP